MTRRIRLLAKMALGRGDWLAVGALCLLGLGLSGLSWWLTAPLELKGTGPSPPSSPPTQAPVRFQAGSETELPPWPEARLEGRAAKELLLKTLEAVDRSFSAIASYTVTFRKQERINGKLLPEQTYFLKVRHEPFAVYMKGLQPVAGRELIYAEGYHDNHVIGHPVGLSRLLVPRLKVPPDHPLILAESRHPMNQAGLGNLIRKLIGYRRLDLEERDATTVLDRIVTPEGRAWLRSTHVHLQPRPGRPLAETEVLYDPATRIPLRFTGYDWPSPGQSEKLLGERYCYDDLVPDAGLTPQDFDPSNPEYAFHRL